MGDFPNFKTESDGFPRRSFILYVLSIVTAATAGEATASSVQTVLPSVIRIAVFRRARSVVVGISRFSAVIGVARVAADGDQTDVARTGVAIAGIAIAVTAVIVPPIPTVPTVVPPIPVVRATVTTAAVRISYADVAVAIAADTLETEGVAVVAARIAAARVAAEKIEKAVAAAIATTAATVTRKNARITSIAHSISILLEYLRIAELG